MSDTNSSERIKHLTVSNVLEEGFRLFFRNIKAMATPAFFYTVCIYLIPALLLIPVFVNFPEITDYFENFDSMSDREASLFMLKFMLPFYAFYFLYIIAAGILFQFLLIAGTSRASDLYLKREVRPLLDILKAGKKFFLPLFGFTLLASIAFFTGYMLLIIPGLVVLVFLSFFAPLFPSVLILENRKFGKAFKRSWALTEGHKGVIFLVQFIGQLIIQVASSIVMSVPMVIFYAIIFANSTFLEEMSSMDDFNGMFRFMGLFMIIFLPLYIIIYTFALGFQQSISISIYYNILKDNEGFSTEQLAGKFLAEGPEEDRA